MNQSYISGGGPDINPEKKRRKWALTFQEELKKTFFSLMSQQAFHKIDQNFD